MCKHFESKYLLSVYYYQCSNGTFFLDLVSGFVRHSQITLTCCKVGICVHAFFQQIAQNELQLRGIVCLPICMFRVRNYTTDYYQVCKLTVVGSGFCFGSNMSDAIAILHVATSNRIILCYF